MAKRRATSPKPPAPAGAYWKWGISILLCLHLLAIVAEPFRFFTRSMRGTSPAADPLRTVLAPYVEFAYFNHGYFFFAPEPGPSHLLECRLELPNGTEGRLVFPDKQLQRPRLLYHRHFMLAEFLHQLHVPPFDANVAAGDARFARDWQAERALFERVRGSMMQHLQAKYQAKSVEIRRLEHRLPSDEEVLVQRVPLNSPTLYITLPDAPLDAAPPLPLPPPGLQDAVPPSASRVPPSLPLSPTRPSPAIEEVQP